MLEQDSKTNKQENRTKLINAIELFNQDCDYIVPVYQRNYAWGESEIEQLIQDINSYKEDTIYYIGTLVVKERKKNEYEVIDGQQRLTTLCLLSIYLKIIKKLSSSFDARGNSNKALQKILELDGKLDNLSEELKNEDFNFDILKGFKIIENIFIKKKINGEEFKESFKNRLKKVKIVRVEVPQDTDLNHYFEVMNNRGEQLEKHEIVKSRMMNKLNNEKERHTFDIIWNACANMEKYVQAGFKPSQRLEIFENKNKLELGFDSINEIINNELETEAVKIDYIIQNKNFNKGKGCPNNRNDEEKIQRFNSIIDFPNFLLHVLRVQKKKPTISLDDKQLIKIFDEELKNYNADNVKKFIMNLLKCKFLYDKYIIKRDKSTDNWILKKLSLDKEGYLESEPHNTFNSDNDKIKMLLSAFHVSNPSMIYKNWLNASLYYLFNETEDIESDKYLNHLELIAKSFVFGIYLPNDKKSYDDLINIDSDNLIKILEEITLDKINKNIKYPVENNFIFNYLDYLLWKKDKSKYSDFKFTFRSSVEHFYPQKPDSGESLDDESLHSFGNLCLISHDKNSRYSNLGTLAKKEYYEKSNSKDSIKQDLMMINADNWNKEAIEKHNDEMVKILVDSLENKTTNHSTTTN